MQAGPLQTADDDRGAMMGKSGRATSKALMHIDEAAALCTRDKAARGRSHCEGLGSSRAYGAKRTQARRKRDDRARPQRVLAVDRPRTESK